MQKKFSLLLYTALLIIVFLTCHSLPGQDIPWEEEVVLLVDELYERHPDLYFQADSTTFVRAMDELSGRGKQLGKFNMAVELQRLVATLGDSHTQVNYTHLVDPELILPLRCFWYEEGIAITRSPGVYSELLGGRLTHINSFPLEQVLDSLSLLLPSDKTSLGLNLLPRMITWVQLLEHFGFHQGGEVMISIEKQDGNPLQLSIRPGNNFMEIARLEVDSIPLGLMKERIFFHDSLMADRGIYYIQYNRCWSRELEKVAGSGTRALFMPSFREFRKKALATAKDEDIQKLILDLRYNPGGNSIQGTRFIKKLSRTKAGKKAEAYLFIGRMTQSSAVINAVDFIRTFDPLVIGENSGGKPNHFGEISRFVLPDSKLVISCSTKYFRLVDGDPPTLVPDVHTPARLDEYLHGTDPAYEIVVTKSR